MVLLNPKAGRRPLPPYTVEQALVDQGINGQVRVPASSEEMVEQARRVAYDPETGLAVVGGDGTAGLVVDGLLAPPAISRPRLAILGGGVRSDLARMFGIPSDLTAAVGLLRRPTFYWMDVGVVRGLWGTRRFVNMAQIGTGARATRIAQRLPRRWGRFGLRLGRWWAWLGVRPTRLHLVGERVDFSGSAHAAMVANGQFWSGGWSLAPKASVVDALYDIQVLSTSRWGLPNLVPILVRGDHLRSPQLHRFLGSTLRVEAERRLPVEVDGDWLGETPVEFSVEPRAVGIKV